MISAHGKGSFISDSWQLDTPSDVLHFEQFACSKYRSAEFDFEIDLINVVLCDSEISFCDTDRGVVEDIHQEC